MVYFSMMGEDVFCQHCLEYFNNNTSFPICPTCKNTPSYDNNNDENESFPTETAIDDGCFLEEMFFLDLLDGEAFNF